MRFYFDGQIEGTSDPRCPFSSDDGPTSRWTRDLATYERLLATTASPLFRQGEWKLLEMSSAGDGSFGDLIAYRWRLDDQVALIVTNLGAGAASGHISAIGDLPRAEAYDFVDELNAVSYHRPRKSLDVRGLYVRLDPAQAHVFIVHRTGSEALQPTITGAVPGVLMGTISRRPRAREEARRSAARRSE